MAGYQVTINEVYGKEIPKKVMAAVKTNLASAIDLATASAESGVVFTPATIAKLGIHNERSKGEKDYEKLLVIDTAGNFYVTGSPSFTDSIMAIWEEMAEENPETWAIEVYQQASGNYKGKNFLTCKVV